MAKSTTIKYTCDCGKVLKLAPNKIGKGMKCPKCQKPIGEGGDELAPKRSKSRVGKTSEGGKRRPTTRRVKPKRKSERSESEAPPEFEEASEPAPEPDTTPEPAAAPTSKRKTTGRHKKTTARADAPAGGGARRTHRTVEGYTALEKVSSFATLFGGLLFIACAIVAGYFVMKGPAAVMAASQKQAVMFAVMFGVLGIISFIVLYVVGQFSRVLLGLVDVIGDLRSRLASSLADDAD